MDQTESDPPPDGLEHLESTRGLPNRMNEREKWGNKTQFLLAMVGQTVGLGNVCSFSYLCYKNGGGAFFIPYFVFLFSCGIPVFFLETALGQYTCEGGVTAWRKICPMFKGVGVASQIIVMYLNVYSIVILAWALLYLYNSFKDPLPWSTCSNTWNSVDCRNQSTGHADWSFLYNNTDYDDMDSNLSWVRPSITPEEEFWSVRILGWAAHDFSQPPGNMRWDLALGLLLAWVVCYFCAWKGVKCIGKVVYFTATFPFLLLLILFIRGILLPGAWEGIKYYLYPDLSKIAYLHVWLEAATQVLFSYGLCRGVLTAIGSYNQYNNDCYKDCLALCFLNAATSIFTGLTVFSVLGYLAHEQNSPIDDIILSEWTGLMFIIYPRAVSLLPGAQFWAVLFFLLVFFLALDNQFLCVESLVVAITDMFPHTLRRPGRHEILVLVTAVACFLLGLPLVTEGGMEIIQLIEMFGLSGSSLLVIACFETIIVGWVYGANRFYDNIEDMIGYQPFPVIKYCWLFVTPIMCTLILAYSLIDTWLYLEILPLWGRIVAALLALAPMLCIVVFVLVAISKNLENITTPSQDLRQACPSKPRLSLCERVIIAGREPTHREPKEEKLAMEHTGAV